MPKPGIISPSELESWLDTSRDFVLLDPFPPEHFEARRLPSAKNACVYEVIFAEHLAKAAPDKTSEIVVYGAGPDSLEAKDAAEKLLEMGYEKIWVLEGGIQGWLEQDRSLEGADPDAADPNDVLHLKDKTYRVDTQASRIEWVGRGKNNNRHYGLVRLSKGEISVAHGVLEAASLIVDLGIIENHDLADDSLRELLLRHLSSRDFFWVEKHPLAEFRLLEALPIYQASPGQANFKLKGELSLRGVTRDLEFPALIANLDDGGFGVSAHFDFDRTLWGVLYGSGRFFRYLGYHLVYDSISVSLYVAAR